MACERQSILFQFSLVSIARVDTAWVHLDEWTESISFFSAF